MTSVMRLESRFGNEEVGKRGPWRVKIRRRKRESPASGGRAPGYRPIAGLGSQPAVDSVQTFLLKSRSVASRNLRVIDRHSKLRRPLYMRDKNPDWILSSCSENVTALCLTLEEVGTRRQDANCLVIPGASREPTQSRLVRNGRKQKCGAEVSIAIAHFYATLL